MRSYPHSNTKALSLLTIGPALADLVFNTSLDRYLKIQNALKLKAGEWKALRNICELDNLFFLLTDHRFNKLSVYNLHKLGFFKLTSGSTNLGLLDALSETHRKRSTMLFCEGVGRDGQKDPLSQMFRRHVENLKVAPFGVPVRGRNPVGFVITTKGYPDRILATYRGVAHDLPYLPHDIDAKFVHIDAFEMQSGKLSKLIDELIRSRRHNVVLGLGNHKILHGRLQAKITEYLRAGLIHILLGNELEFRVLTGHDRFDAVADIEEIKYAEKVPNLLITLGGRGMFARINDRSYYQQAVGLPKIVNTSGAGDTAAGTFLSGLLDQSPPKDILKRAAFNAALVLGQSGNVLRRVHECYA